MEILKNYLGDICFHIKWLFMSRKDKYAYLWSRTKESHGAVKIYYSYPSVVKVGRTVVNRKDTERIRLYKPPAVCPRSKCGGTYFIPHEDGWQCWNCMKIIYEDSPLTPIYNNRITRITEKVVLCKTSSNPE